MKTDIQIGKFTLWLPDESSKQYYIFHDLAELFGVEFQSEAVKILKKELETKSLKPKPDIDCESDGTSIRTTNADCIYQVALSIDKLTMPEQSSGFTNSEWTDILRQLKEWKRPKPKKWMEGDIFCFKLQDGSFTFGQIVKKPTEITKIPTLALFDVKSEKQQIDFNQLKRANVITILHLLEMNLQNGKWEIIGNLNKILADPFSGPWRKHAKTGSPGILESVANYYWFKTHEYKDVSQLTELIMKKNRFYEKLKKYWR
jgi:hypothetical protein